ncbi:MAG: hypothetical protein Q7R68_10390, partial [Nitrospirales bacterium]|nr:hypothetical protein [Nitrospirales bacterium]
HSQPLNTNIVAELTSSQPIGLSRGPLPLPIGAVQKPLLHGRDREAPRSGLLRVAPSQAHRSSAGRTARLRDFDGGPTRCKMMMGWRRTGARAERKSVQASHRGCDAETL